MSRTKPVPAYRLHKQSGQAIVTLPDGLGGRHDFLLGEHDTLESRAEYDRVIAEWLANNRHSTRALPPDATSVNEVVLVYWQWVEGYYRHPDGTPTSEVNNIKQALRRLRALYGHCPVSTFTSLSLDSLREQMIAEGLARGRINKDVSRIKRLFKWLAGKALVPLSVHQSLQTVEGLRAGRSAAKETAPVRPVADAQVEATLPHMRPQVAAMVRVQRLTGMRPGEVILMRGIDLDVTGPTWVYRPGSDQGPHGQHKTAHRGITRAILIGPRAAEVLRPWLRLNVSEYLFQPQESKASYDAERRQKRKTPITPSHAKRRPKQKPKKRAGEHYTVSSYEHAIIRGCILAHCATCNACERHKEETRKAWLVRVRQCPGFLAIYWHPHQLRHAAATEIRKAAGLDAARAVLGHRTPSITETYAELDMGKASEVMERLG